MMAGGKILQDTEQHLAYSRLRAIETRREIARSANTGISCFVTPYGEIEQTTPYWEQAMISKNMTPNTINKPYL
jgi:apolipoprotein N-acyltransferase